MTKVTDRLADKTGLGEAVVGALFLGGSTSLSGIVTSVTAAAGGYAELAISNALGETAAQTAFLSVADIVYRKANLEHAAASPANLTQGTLLLTLLTISLLGRSSGECLCYLSSFCGHFSCLYIWSSIGFCCSGTPHVEATTHY